MLILTNNFRHNIHHYFEFFKAIRKHVHEDNIEELIDHLKKQKDSASFDEKTGMAKSDLISSEDNVTKKLKIS